MKYLIPALVGAISMVVLAVFILILYVPRRYDPGSIPSSPESARQATHSATSLPEGKRLSGVTSQSPEASNGRLDKSGAVKLAITQGVDGSQLNPIGRSKATLISRASPLRELGTDRSSQPETISNSPNPITPSQEDSERNYILRVIDGISRDPIQNAAVVVELENKNLKARGLTDSAGFFQYTLRAPRGQVYAHTSIRAKGFLALDEYGGLIEDRVIPLNRAD